MDLLERIQTQRTKQDNNELIIDGIGNDLLFAILSFLDVPTLGRAEAVSRRFRTVVPHVWKLKARTPLRYYFRRTFATGPEMLEITICAVGKNGKLKLVFATSGVERQGNSEIVLLDRIAEQHPMLTHQFGVVPRFSVTLRKCEDRPALDCMELRFQIAPR